MLKLPLRSNFTRPTQLLSQLTEQRAQHERASLGTAHARLEAQPCNQAAFNAISHAAGLGLCRSLWQLPRRASATPGGGLSAVAPPQLVCASMTLHHISSLKTLPSTNGGFKSLLGSSADATALCHQLFSLLTHHRSDVPFRTGDFASFSRHSIKCLSCSRLRSRTAASRPRHGLSKPHQLHAPHELVTRVVPRSLHGRALLRFWACALDLRWAPTMDRPAIDATHVMPVDNLTSAFALHLYHLYSMLSVSRIYSTLHRLPYITRRLLHMFTASTSHLRNSIVAALWTQR